MIINRKSLINRNDLYSVTIYGSDLCKHLLVTYKITNSSSYIFLSKECIYEKNLYSTYINDGMLCMDYIIPKNLSYEVDIIEEFGYSVVTKNQLKNTLLFYR